MPRPSRAQPTSRLTLDLAEPVRQMLDKLKEDTVADSLVEVVRKALAVYAFLHDAKQKGCVIVVRNDNTEREVVLL